jgi:hypothetical protein
MGIFHRISAWWNKDREELSEEEAEISQSERDVAEEDYESRVKDEVVVEHEFAAGAGGETNFERDSEGPPKY